MNDGFATNSPAQTEPIISDSRSRNTGCPTRPGYQKDTLFRAQFGLRFPIFRSGFQVPVEVVSTPTENIVLNGYFPKIPVLIGFCSCNIAGF